MGDRACLDCISCCVDLDASISTSLRTSSLCRRIHSTFNQKLDLEYYHLSTIVDSGWGIPAALELTSGGKEHTGLSISYEIYRALNGLIQHTAAV
jgi:hypothetical protein